MAWLASSRLPGDDGLPLLCFEQARLKKTSGATWSLPRVRRQLLARLIRLSGRCAWCLTEFTDTS